MNHVSFFLRHALVHLSRERQRTLFVLFCIAAGVASVVSLRTLGLMVSDALARDLQMANRGDIAIEVPTRIELKLPGKSAEDDRVDETLLEIRGNTDQVVGLSRSGEARLEVWANARGFETMPLWSNNGPFARISKAGGDSAHLGDVTQSVMILCVDQTRYPFYGTVHIVAPTETTLAQALSGPYDLAVTDGLAEDLGLDIGERVHLAGASRPFAVAAIVSPRSEASLTDPLYAAFPFVYVPYQTCTDDLRQRPNTYYIQVTDDADVDSVKQEILARFRGLQPTTTADLRQVTDDFSDSLLKLVTVMGLVSLLIGGIGIANTMTVVVTRRTLEIAVLKTIGVQGHQITWMFIVEALVLGALGSVLGIPLGLGLVLVLQTFAERFVAQTMQFALYPQALGMGVMLGIVVTVVFGLLPTLSAGRVRPNLVLRPAEAAMPQAGRLASLLTLMALTAVMGVIAGQLLGNVGAGVLAAYATVLILGLALLALRVFVWAISHLPSFGIISLKLSQREMSAQKGRVANTLLALVTGIFSLGLIWLLVQGSIQLISDTVATFLEGNVMVAITAVEDGKALERTIARLPDVSFTHDTVYVAEIVAVNGNRDIEVLKHQAEIAAGGTSVTGDPRTAIDEFIATFDMKVLDTNTWSYEVVQGEDIAGDVATRASPNDGTPILLEPSPWNQAFVWFGLEPGDTLTLRFPGGARRTAVIAGVTAPHNAGFLMQGLIEFRATYSIVPPRFVPRGELPQPTIYTLTVPDDQMNETLDIVSAMPGIYAFPTAELVAYTERFADQFVPLPLIVSALALFASSVIIANTVSLTTLERRRQIGIMKALGLQAERVLGLLLLENGLVGLAGGLLGTGLSALIIVPSGALGQGDIPVGALGLLILLAVGLTLGATTVTAYGAAQEKPLKVLRYE